MRIEIAKKVVAHYKKFPIPLATSETNDEWKYFEYPFSVTDEEGEVLCQLMPYPQHIDDIAERLGRDKKELIPLLDGLVHKTWVIRDGPKEDALYRAQTHAVGAIEMQEKYTSGTLESFRKTAEHRPTGRTNTLQAVFGETPDIQPWYRVLPWENAIPHDVEVFPSELFSHIVEHAGAKGLGVCDCYCRKSAKYRGGGCNGPVEGVCMAFGPYARTGIETGSFREVSKDEMLKIAKRCQDAGLVQEACTCEHTILICNCCVCCCGVLRTWDVGVPQALMKSNFEPSLDLELCNGCQACIKICPMKGSTKAITLDRRTKRPVFNLEKCVGCGLCVTSCPVEGALIFKRKDKDKITPYFHSYDEVLHYRAQQTGRTELYKDYHGEEMV